VNSNLLLLVHSGLLYRSITELSSLHAVHFAFVFLIDRMTNLSALKMHIIHSSATSVKFTGL
jgi:hypothetical protein